MLDGIEICLNTDFFDNEEKWKKTAKKIIFTGMIDKYFKYCYGELQHRSLKFETEVLETADYQGNAVINYTEYDIPYTRIIEHKHFDNTNSNKTVITREYPDKYEEGKEPYYQINNEQNERIYNKYKLIAKKEKNVIFGGRLGEYKYYNMDEVIKRALELVEDELDE